MTSLHDADREVLETAVRWLEAGERPALVTVAKTWGSSPRPPGSLMAMTADGRQAGSVSGGCVEADLLERFRSGQLGEHFPTRIDYGVDHARASRLGLPCGGRLELVIERLESAVPLRRILDRGAAGMLVTRRVCLNTGEVSLHTPAATDATFRYEADTLYRTFGPRWLLLLIGDGELARYVTQLALTLGYRVVICDPRDVSQDDSPPDGVECVRSMPDEAVRAYITHARSAVVALSHDPKLDDMALYEALQSPAFYVGALGSRANSAARRERLRSLGLADTGLRRLHAPVGLPIGSHAPPEIALSILAELTALRNGVPAPCEAP